MIETPEETPESPQIESKFRLVHIASRRAEQLMLGAVTADELGEGLSPAAISRDQALEWIADGRRPR